MFTQSLFLCLMFAHQSTLQLARPDFPDDQQRKSYYSEAHSSGLPSFVNQLIRDTQDNIPLANLMTSRATIRLNALLIRAMKATKIMDIGLYTGMHALAAADAMPNNGIVYGLDSKRDFWQDYGERFAKKNGLERKIKMVLSPDDDLVAVLDKMMPDHQGTFDFCYIHAIDKSNYFDYYRRCLKLLRKGGVITIDDVLWATSGAAGPTIFESQTMDRLNKLIREDEHVLVSMVPQLEGLSIVYKL